MNPKIQDLFSGITDPRVNRTKKHPLESILHIVLCGNLAGIDSWTGLQDYAEIHEGSLSELIDLPDGIPSHDTIARVIGALDVEEFAASFESFTAKLFEKAKDIIAIDGETMRGSAHSGKKLKAKHIVSAWAQGSKLALGQVKVDEKSNEITAIPELLKKLDFQGQIVTIDAMGCQRDSCSQLVNAEGDYIIALKKNQPTLHDDVKLWLEDSKNTMTHSWEEWDKGHGRIEHRLCWSSDNIDWLQERHNWPGLKSISAIYSSRETKNGREENVRFYISSLPANAEKIANAVRSHWGIENSLHWILEVTFNEDKSRIPNENAPKILAIIRKWSLTIINQHKGKLTTPRFMRFLFAKPQKLIQLLAQF